MCREQETLLRGEQAMSLRVAALWEQGCEGRGGRDSSGVGDTARPLTSGGHGCHAPCTDGRVG